MATSTGWTRFLNKNNIPRIRPRKPLRIDMSKQDCNKGKPGCSRFCTLAEKLKSMGIGVADVHVYNRVVHVLMTANPDTGKPGVVDATYSLDKKTREAILNFDKGIRFTPGTYIFHPLPPSERKKARKCRDAKRADKSHGKKNRPQFPPLHPPREGTETRTTRKYEDNWN